MSSTDAAAAAGAGGISLKLLVDMKRRKVVFAEANKVFVDFLLQANDVCTAKKFYVCSGTGYKCYSYSVAYDPKALCRCGQPISKEATFFARNLKTKPVGVDGGFEEGRPTYIITDDLQVKHTSPSVTSSIKILKDLDVKDVSEIQETVVWLNPDEISKLHASSMDKKGNGVLTKMFFP